MARDWQGGYVKDYELKNELNRKVLESLSNVITDKENKVISNVIYSYAVRILWETYSGLADKEFSFVIEEMGRDADFLEKEETDFLFVHKGKIIRLVYSRSGKLELATYDSGGNPLNKKEIGFEGEAFASAQADRECVRLVKRLKAMGAREL